MKMRIIAITALLLLLTYSTAQAAEHESIKKLNIVSKPQEFLKASDPAHFVEVVFDRTPLKGPQVFNSSLIISENFVPSARYEVIGNAIRFFSPGTGNVGSYSVLVPNYGWFNVGVAGDYATLTVVDFPGGPGGGDVTFKVHVQMSPSDPRPVVGRKVRLKIQTQGGLNGNGMLYGWPVTIGLAAEGVTDFNGDALLTAHFYRDTDGHQVKLKNLQGFDALIPADSKSKMHRLVAFVAPEGQSAVLNSWQEWQAGNRWPNIMVEPFETGGKATPNISPGGVSNHIDLTPDFLSRVFNSVIPPPGSQPEPPASNVPPGSQPEPSALNVQPPVMSQSVPVVLEPPVVELPAPEVNPDYTQPEPRPDPVPAGSKPKSFPSWVFLVALPVAALAAARFLPFPVPYFRSVCVSVELQPLFGKAKAIISRDSRGPREVKVEFVGVSPSNRITQEIILPKNASRTVEIPAGELVTAKIRTPNWKNVSKKTFARLYFKNGGVDKEWSG
jgi:hypothetical protein